MINKFFEAGTGKEEMTCFLPGIGMMGYGQHHNVVKEIATPLWARSLFIRSSNEVFILVHLEQAFVTMAIKEEVILRLRIKYPSWNISDANLAITAQHTHSAPGGYSHYPLYNFTIPGFQVKVFEKVVGAIVTSIEEAYGRLQKVRVLWGEHRIDDSKEVAFNRSMAAYARNPEAEHKSEENKHLALDRNMQGLSFVNEANSSIAFLNWFGVHGTSISSYNQRIHHDNKGIAAALYEKNHPGTTAFFLQAAAGDVSPNFIWDKKTKLMRGKFSDQYESAEFNGEIQFRESEKINFRRELKSEMAFFHLFMDMSKEVAIPAHGVAFFRGTLEGPGVPSFLGDILEKVSRYVRRRNLRKNPEIHSAFYQAHGNKDVLLDHRSGSFLGIPLSTWNYLPPLPEPSLEAMRKTCKARALETLPWVPPILPFQILKLGQLVIAFAPGEITGISAQRLRSYLVHELSDTGIEEVIISSYANAFMGYITTPEEYDRQCYEGGHTVYGRGTLAGIIKGFSYLTYCFKNKPIPADLPTKPFKFPAEELARRSIE